MWTQPSTYEPSTSVRSSTGSHVVTVFVCTVLAHMYFVHMYSLGSMYQVACLHDCMNDGIIYCFMCFIAHLWCINERRGCKRKILLFCAAVLMSS